jgi:hypothetical protein
MKTDDTEDMLDAIKASLAKVLPGAMVTFAGVMLMLAIGVAILTELPPLVRLLTDPLPQPFRSAALFFLLAVPLAVLAWSGRRLMGYTVSQMMKRTKQQEGDR